MSQRERSRIVVEEGEIWPLARHRQQEMDGERIEFGFKDLQRAPSLLANFVSTAIFESLGETVVPAGVRTGNIRTRTDGPRFDLRLLLPRPREG